MVFDIIVIYLACAVAYFLFWVVVLHDRFKKIMRDTKRRFSFVFAVYSNMDEREEKRAIGKIFFFAFLWIALIWPVSLFKDIRSGFRADLKD